MSARDLAKQNSIAMGSTSCNGVGARFASLSRALGEDCSLFMGLSQPIPADETIHSRPIPSCKIAWSLLGSPCGYAWAGLMLFGFGEECGE